MIFGYFTNIFFEFCHQFFTSPSLSRFFNFPLAKKLSIFFGIFFYQFIYGPDINRYILRHINVLSDHILKMWSDLRSLFNLMILIWSQIRILVIFQYSTCTIHPFLCTFYSGLNQQISFSFYRCWSHRTWKWRNRIFE